MVKNKSFQIVILLLIIISIVILLYIVLFRAQGPQTAPAGETGKQQETAPQQEATAEEAQETVVEERAEEVTPVGAVTGEVAPAP